MTRVPIPLCVACLIVGLMLAGWPGSPGAQELDVNGHLKGRYQGSYFPADSFFRLLAPATIHDLAADARINLQWTDGPWQLQADYNLIVENSDSREFLGGASGLLPGNGPGLINDDRRWWNLTHVINDDPSSTAVQRLDRLSIGYTGAWTSVRFGRQAVSWGNGLIYNPVDVFNPFDPLAVDTEYKTGDDMLYGQWLRENGDDLQIVAVVRRDLASGEVSSDQGSLAAKYHGFLGTSEYDLLVAQHYDEPIIALGGSTDWREAIVRGDLTATRTDRGTVVSGVVNAAYSWVWAGKNVSGTLEYFHNGFGQPAGQYSPQELLDNPDLLDRLLRGELFTQGKNYLAGSLLIEITPLLNVSPNLFVNLGDASALLQVVTRYDWQQNLTLLGSLALPIGGKGSEFGGPSSGLDGLDLEVGPSAFLQLAYYF